MNISSILFRQKTYDAIYQTLLRHLLLVIPLFLITLLFLCPFFVVMCCIKCALTHRILLIHVFICWSNPV